MRNSRRALRKSSWCMFLYGAGAGFCSLFGFLLLCAGLRSYGYPVFLILVGLSWLAAVWCVVRARNSAREFSRQRETSTWSVSAAEYGYDVAARRQVAAAFEIERRRIERDLHDGAQQFLVAASIDVGEAALILDDAATQADADLTADFRESLAEARSLMASAQDRTELALRALRRTVAGIHPKVLSDLGLEAAVRDLAETSPLDVELVVPEPLPEITEGVTAAGYFAASEALTNAAKYARDAHVVVLLTAGDNLVVSASDDGPGGAVLREGGGLAGLAERLASFGGSLTVSSPPGGPTVVAARIPLLLQRGEFGVAGESRARQEGHEIRENSDS